MIPVGKDHNTVTSKTGPARSILGADIKLVEEGGVVSLDDWRGIEIFPPPSGHSTESTFVGQGEWTEDDGVSLEPALTIIAVEYTVSGNEIKVSATFKDLSYETAWGSDVWVLLPYGDERTVQGASEVVDKDGRKAYKITIQ